MSQFGSVTRHRLRPVLVSATERSCVAPIFIGVLGGTMIVLRGVVESCRGDHVMQRMSRISADWKLAAIVLMAPMATAPTWAQAPKDVGPPKEPAKALGPRLGA